jgi:RNA 2',3'-cyclic 3'-phosphodiesterase
MRLFVALDLPDSIKDKIVTLHDTSLHGASWTSRDQWHITLHFIGERDSDSTIRESLSTVEMPSFELYLAGVGQFPEQGKPRVLWAGIQAPKTLQQLHAATGEALKSTGYEPESRPYNPHLTLARFKQTAPSRDKLQAYFDTYDTFKTELFLITHFTLYESELRQSGAVYTAREKFSLLTSL